MIQMSRCYIYTPKNKNLSIQIFYMSKQIQSKGKTEKSRNIHQPNFSSEYLCQNEMVQPYTDTHVSEGHNSTSNYVFHFEYQIHPKERPSNFVWCSRSDVLNYIFGIHQIIHWYIMNICRCIRITVLSKKMGTCFCLLERELVLFL